MEKAKKLLGVLWGVLLNVLKKKAIQKVVMLIVGSTSGGWAWLVAFIAEIGWDKIGVPLFNLAKRKGLFIFDYADGQIKVLKLKEAKESNNENDYNNVIDNS